MSNTKVKLGIIGCGSMGSAIILGLINTKLYQPQEIILFNRSQPAIDQLLQQGNFQQAKSYQELFDLETLIIAVKPKDIKSTLAELKGLSETTVLISVAAGLKISSFAEFFPQNPIIRAMPNTPCQIAQGATVIAANDKCSDIQIERTQKIFESIGLSMILEEKNLDAVTALSGSGPAYIFLMIEAMTEAAVKLGLPHEAEAKHASQTVYGASALVQETGEAASELRVKVTSPGGTTQAALESFADSDFREIVAKALKAASDRSKDLS